METADKNAAQFFELARERQNIYLKKESGLPPPWTDNKVMQGIYLCNVFREQDKTTVWLRENIRDRYHNDPIRLLSAITLFRWFNRIETGEYIFPDHFEEWLSIAKGSYEDAGQYLFEALELMEPPYFTSAYMIKADNDIRKTLSVSTAAAIVAKSYMEEVKVHGGPVLFTTLQGWTEWLMGFHGLGGFMAYEVTTDLRHTPLANQSTDIMTWANPGPGCARGLSRLYYDSLGHSGDFMRDRYRTLQVMKWLLDLSTLEKHWPQDSPNWPKWEMRDIEHFLCEYDKILRVTNGEGRSKRRYDRGIGKLREAVA